MLNYILKSSQKIEIFGFDNYFIIDKINNVNKKVLNGKSRDKFS
jgi:hypothetical protein